jgi:hypothetical protein
VSASQLRDHEFDTYSGRDHVSSYDTSTGWFQEADSKVINLSCKNLFRNGAKITTFKPRNINCAIALHDENNDFAQYTVHSLLFYYSYYYFYLFIHFFAGRGV